MTVIDIASGLPPKFYFSSAAWILYTVFVVFSLIFIAISLFVFKKNTLKRDTQSGYKSKLAISLLILLFLSWPLLDALLFSYKTAAICESEGGLRVYDTAEADGFRGHLKDWSNLGFSFIEHRGPKRTKVREFLENGEQKTMLIDEFTTRYRIQVPYSRKLNEYMWLTEIYVEDGNTGKRLGEIRSLGFRGTKFDRLAAFVFRLDRNPHHCGNETTDGRETYGPHRGARIYNKTDLVKATLIPRKNDY